MEAASSSSSSSSSTYPSPSPSPLSLLPFAKSIIRSIVPRDEEPLDEGDALILLARGLGLRSIIATILKIYDGPNNLVILVNALPDEEAGLSEELTTLGVRKPGLRSVGYEVSSAARKNMYASGGIISVTSRILIVDMLQKSIPTEFITGIVMLHAEDVTPTSTEAFIARVYRDKNRDGFLKAFSDNAEAFATGLSPLQTVLGQLMIRKVELWPRFHKSIIRDLGQRKADVIELYQPLSRSMRNIQTAIVECVDATLTELKRCAKTVDLDNYYTLDNAIFKAFDVMVQRQLQPRWHQLGFKTKQLVNDLKELRKLLNFLVTHDAVAFNEYLETLIAAQTTTASGTRREQQSPWLFMDAANTIFNEAKARLYIGSVSHEAEARQHIGTVSRQPQDAPSELPPLPEEAPIEIDSDEEEAAFGAPRPDKGKRRADKHHRPSWLPPGLHPVLEEQPKWHLLREVLDEIEQDIFWREEKEDVHATNTAAAPNNTILIMTADGQTCAQVRRFLDQMDPCIIGGPEQGHDAEGEDVSAESSAAPGRRMMLRNLKNYFFWKGALGKMRNQLRAPDPASVQPDKAAGAGSNRTSNTGNGSNGPNGQQPYESDALKRKQIWERGQPPPNKRRRQRGGGVAGSNPTRPKDPASASDWLEQEAGDIADFVERAMEAAEENGDSDSGDDGDDGDGDDIYGDFSHEAEGLPRATGIPRGVAEAREAGFEITGVNRNTTLDALDSFTQDDLDNFFGVLSMDNLIVVRPYKGDADDYVLQELRPRFIIMYDPDPAFVRRIEMYRALAGQGADPRVYFLLYAESVEEQRYLSSLRREKESFEKLIREKSTMVLPLVADGRRGAAATGGEDEGDQYLRTINSRVAGGQRSMTGATRVQPRIVVDMREFRSSLPSMLHAAGIDVVPCTLTVGDYILSPEMCVERKSLPDLVQSFNSGRLYAQCELMSVHYRHPILLIEFDQGRAFALQSAAEAGGGGGGGGGKGKQAATSGGGAGAGADGAGMATGAEIDVQSKLVMLTAAFPRLRIIWSSSPPATADVFAELKATYDEPDVEAVAQVGLGEGSSAAGAGAGAGAGTSSSASRGTTTEHEQAQNQNQNQDQTLSLSLNLTPQDMLRSLPGITTKNYTHVMRSTRDLEEVCASLGEAELGEVIGKEPARALVNFAQRSVGGAQEIAPLGLRVARHAHNAVVLRVGFAAAGGGVRLAASLSIGSEVPPRDGVRLVEGAHHTGYMEALAAAADLELAGVVRAVVEVAAVAALCGDVRRWGEGFAWGGGGVSDRQGQGNCKGEEEQEQGARGAGGGAKRRDHAAEEVRVGVAEKVRVGGCEWRQGRAVEAEGSAI